MEIPKYFILSMFLLLIASVSAQGGIASGLSDLQSGTQTLTLLSILVQFVIAVVFIIVGVMIYLKKLKGNPKKDLLWTLLAILMFILGIFFLLGVILGILTYISAPIISNSISR